MYHVYTIKNRSEFSKTLVAETKDYDLALQKAHGSMNSYGELIATVVAEG